METIEQKISSFKGHKAKPEEKRLFTFMKANIRILVYSLSED